MKSFEEKDYPKELELRHKLSDREEYNTLINYKVTNRYSSFLDSNYKIALSL